jgi:hypothetical protein
MPVGIGAAADGEAVHAGYEAAKRVYELGQAVRARRLEVGMSQTELAHSELA